MTYLKHTTFLALIMLLFTCKKKETKLTKLENGLVAHYPFDENIEDKSTNQNHAITYKASYKEDRTGNPNRSIFFDGDSTIFYAPHIDQLNFEKEFTIALWVKFLNDDLNSRDVVIAKGNLGAVFSKRATFQLSIVQSRTYVLNILSGTGIVPDKVNAGNESMDTWNHVTAIFYNKTLSFYLNGDFVANQLVEEDLLTNQEPITIGTIINYQSDGSIFNIQNSFEGNIDDVRIYNRALNFVEIKELQGL